MTNDGPVPTTPLAMTFPGSNIIGARFDAATGVLEVDFKNSSSYRYQNFTAAQATEWQAAKSAGQWFDANVKKQPDKHPWVSVPKPSAASAAPVPAPAPAPASPQATTELTPAAESPRASDEPPKAPPVAPIAELAVDYQDSSESVRAMAKGAYEAYIANSGGKSWDGKQCPPFEQTGNVRSHWCAAVLDTMGRAGMDAMERRDLSVQIEHLKKVARLAEEGAKFKLEAKVQERTAMLDGEVSKLREQLADAEVKLKAKATFAPWRT